jgi:DNA-binding transcriptional ArsR family regulator
LAIESFPQIAGFRKPLLACTGEVRQKSAASGRVACNPEAAVLTYVPVVFDVYRPLKPYLRWTLQCLVGFADHSGKCFPSVRKLSEVSDVPRSTVSRHLAELVKSGAITRTRRPGGVYTYQITARFLPATRVSHARAAAVPPARAVAVPPVRREEQPIKNRSDSPVGVTEELRERWKWGARTRQWHNSGGTHWPLQWGPRPEEPGCQIPHDLLISILGQQPDVRERVLSSTTIAR